LEDIAGQMMQRIVQITMFLIAILQEVRFAELLKMQLFA